jgi:Mn2+/Fe2+ NRAMP family transporter
VSGAADTDPTTVATLVVVGATTVYRLAWLTLLLFAVPAVMQTLATRIGAVVALAYPVAAPPGSSAA